MARVMVDHDRCEGHGLCEQAAPQELWMDDEGTPHPRHDQVPADLMPAAQAAVRACPVAALTLEQ
jgi:ferredoxin